MYRERKNIRLKNRNYSTEGVYFITICCHGRKSHLGKIENNKMHLSDIGRIALEYWMEIPIHFPHGRLDEFIIMPNHLHGILILDYSIVGPHHRVALRHSPENDTVSIRDGMAMDQGHHTNQFSKPLKNSVSVIINQYKSSVKRWCNKNRFKHFEWQSRFYDHIVYDECSVDNIRAYIKNNPSDWCEDDLFI